jgi:archaellum component FlaG (FlaF/FlaG flagellin family)
VGIGTTNPDDAKLEINSNSTIIKPQLKLFENDGDYARLTFQNTSGPSYWSIAGLNHATNANELFNIYNSVSGNVISISGTGNTGINHVPDVVRKLYVDGENNGAGYFSNNSNSFNTLKVINQGSSAAGYFSSEGTEYTLYVKNQGTGPAALFDGSLQVAGGNSSEINRNQTGTANIVPVCYGSVEANGTKNTGGSTSNFTVTKVNPGIYDITITGETYAQNTHCAIASLGDPGFINTNASSGKLRVNTYSITGTVSDKEFSFVIYRP